MVDFVIAENNTWYENEGINLEIMPSGIISGGLDFDTTEFDYVEYDDYLTIQYYNIPILGDIYVNAYFTDNLYASGSELSKIEYFNENGGLEITLSNLTLTLDDLMASSIPLYAGDDWFSLSENDDHVVGAAGNDIILAFGGDDRIFGYADNDWIWGGLGNDHLDGGAGHDTIEYIYPKSDYVIFGTATNLISLDVVLNEIDYLSNFEELVFEDSSHSLNSATIASLNQQLFDIVDDTTFIAHPDFANNNKSTFFFDDDYGIFLLKIEWDQWFEAVIDDMGFDRELATIKYGVVIDQSDLSGDDTPFSLADLQSLIPNFRGEVVDWSQLTITDSSYSTNDGTPFSQVDLDVLLAAYAAEEASGTLESFLNAVSQQYRIALEASSQSQIPQNYSDFNWLDASAWTVVEHENSTYIAIIDEGVKFVDPGYPVETLTIGVATENFWVSETFTSISESSPSVETIGAISATNTGAGNDVVLDFYVDPALITDDVTSFDMVVSFDSNGASYVSADLGDFLGFPNAGGDTITLSGISLSGVSSSDPLFTLNFTDLDTSEDLTISISDVVVNGTSLEGSTLLIGGPDTVDVTAAVISRSGASLSDVALSFDDGSDVITINTNESGSSTASITSGSGLTVTASLDYAKSSKSVTSQDALDALRLSVGMDTQSGTSTAFDYIAADFNQDGKVSSQDALAILKYAVGLTTTEQAEWVFVDANGDYSDISRSNTNYNEGINIADLTSATELGLTGILIGDVNDSYSGLIA